LKYVKPQTKNLPRFFRAVVAVVVVEAVVAEMTVAETIITIIVMAVDVAINEILIISSK
jgi:hypothetical protein